MILDVDERLLIADDGKAVRLTGNELSFLAATAKGELVKFDRLISEIWGMDEPEYGKGSVGVIVHKLRRKLAERHITTLIKAVWGVGYKLCEPLTVRRAGPAPVTIPGEHRATFQRLMYSHPERAAADRVLASIVGG